MTMTVFLTPFLPTTIFLLATFPLNNAACPWVRYCYNVINTFSTGDDLPFCNTLWHIFCTLNTSQLKATMKLKNLLAVIQSNLLFCLYILHSSFLAPPVIDQLLGVSPAAESSMRQQWEDLRQWLCPGKGETFKYHFHFSKPKKLLYICKHISFVWAKVMLFKTTQRQFLSYQRFCTVSLEDIWHCKGQASCTSGDTNLSAVHKGQCRTGNSRQLQPSFQVANAQELASELSS